MPISKLSPFYSPRPPIPPSSCFRVRPPSRSWRPCFVFVEAGFTPFSLSSDFLANVFPIPSGPLVSHSKRASHSTRRPNLCPVLRPISFDLARPTDDRPREVVGPSASVPPIDASFCTAGWFCARFLPRHLQSEALSPELGSVPDILDLAVTFLGARSLLF